MQRRNTKSDYNTSEHPHLQRLNAAHTGDRTVQHVFCDRTVRKDISPDLQHRIDTDMHNKERNHRRKRCNFFLLFRHTDSHTHRKDQRKIIKNYISRTAHDRKECVQDRSLPQNTLEAIGLDHSSIGK